MSDSLSTGSLQGTIGKFRVYRQLKLGTKNELYLVHKEGQPIESLYFLKHYSKPQCYSHQQRILQFEPVFGSHYITSAPSYTICQYSRHGSILELGQTIKQFPLPCIKFYLYAMFYQLKCIHQCLGVPFRTVYHSDVVIAEDFNVYVVGWAKEEPTTEEEVIYDIGEIAYYMVVNRVLQDRAIQPRGRGKRRFVGEDFWEVRHKGLLGKCLGVGAEEASQWTDFVKRITTQGKDGPNSLSGVLQDEFFKDVCKFETVVKLMSEKITLVNAKEEKKIIQSLSRKMKRARLVDYCCQEDQIESPFQEQKPICRIAQPPVIQQKISISKRSVECGDRRKEVQKKQCKETQFKEQATRFELVNHKLLELFSSHFGSTLVFKQNWIRVESFCLKPLQVSQGHFKLLLQCYLQYIDEADYTIEKDCSSFLLSGSTDSKRWPDFLAEINLEPQNSNLHQILQLRLRDFIKLGLMDFFCIQI